MKYHHGLTTILLILILTGLVQARYIVPQGAVKRNDYNPGDPPYRTIGVHDVGKIVMSVTNYGAFGLAGEATTDPLTGLPAYSLNYPKNSDAGYLWGGSLWIGGIVDGQDTLVSVASQNGYWDVQEFWALPYPDGDISFRSINSPYDSLYDSAISQQDIVAIYTDTLDDPEYTGYDQFTGRNHRPLNVQVTQRSYAWGNGYADDFIIFDYRIANIEIRTLKDVYIGLYFDNDCGRISQGGGGGDDIVDYLYSRRSRYIAGLVDTLDMVWAADNDGDPNPYTGAYSGFTSPTAAIGVKILKYPRDKKDYNFNWWVSSYNPDEDWGPRRRDPNGIRTFFGNLGTPLSDEQRYYVMANGEFDYPQSQVTNDHYAEGWLSPPEFAASIAGGGDIKYVISFGPFDIEPGEAIPLTFAIVAGEKFYTDGGLARGPGTFRDPTYLQLNALWADWVYDNPGVDTDNDGNRGNYYISCINPKFIRIDSNIVTPYDTVFDTVFECTFSDTLFYKGDGVPDFKGALPPPNPDFRIYTELDTLTQLGTMVINWNGLIPETAPDQFSQEIDFEGYRVYTSRSGNSNDFTLITSYDVENYNRHEFNIDLGYWVIPEKPFTRRLLNQMYGDDFDPNLYYNEQNLFEFYDWRTASVDSFYFSPHDWNNSDYYDTTLIHKLYPDESYPPTLNLDTAKMFYPEIVTPEGRLKYFEYEYILKDLIPSVPHYISVTVFDHGFPEANLIPMETKPADNAIMEYAQNSNSIVEERNLDVIVYPNPYMADGNYREVFEGWEEPDLTAERTHALHFTNLPHRCTIRIYSLDGDLIDSFEHDYPKDSPGSMHDTWDMITRNDMAIVSGIYYFAIESEYGNQVGTFVVIY
ncbi:MAG: hypothetical protein ABIJ45_14255 [Candidatus Zixiibacteriota bacterium]